MLHKKLSSALSKHVKPILAQRGFSDTRIITEWGCIVGQKISRFTSPIQIKYPRTDNVGATLVVKCESGFALEFSYMEPRIIERISTYLGCRLVSRIQILNAPVVKSTTLPKTEMKNNNTVSCKAINKVKESTANVENDELRTILTRLGTRIEEHTPNE